MIEQLQAADFNAWRDRVTQGDTLPVVLDVREPWELQTATVTASGFRLLHIPMNELPARLAELQDGTGNPPIACLCHHGMRSLKVAHFLVHNGLTDIVNLSGGIAAWSQQIDPSVPLY